MAGGAPARREAPRGAPQTDAALAPLLMRALEAVRYHDAPLSLARYGEYQATDTSATRELLATLASLGPAARAVAGELQALRGTRTLSRALRLDLARALQAIGRADAAPSDAQADAQEDAQEEAHEEAASCCAPPAPLVLAAASWQVASPQIASSRDASSKVASPHDASPKDASPARPIAALRLQDHAGAKITFGEFFAGQPAIVVFFYTRCDNPKKCSLTVAKLAAMQKLLDAQGLGERVRTAAITYDPGFDLPERLAAYGRDRGVRLDAQHRMLRALDGNAALQAHFRLGVNYVASLVNRHRIEAYVLDRDTRIAAAFARLQLEPAQVVARAAELLKA